ncbi:hypothetical protein [uncultured Modestobacter sp.]|uniref:hypothetical protein n=1 Tax=uncultured Modestobacter sp. TaxID=380048 RepID=UPI0026086AAA|nr:hypothetical protein [uncultured Modestobacter sp.]
MGRDRIEKALRRAGAVIDSLSLGPPDLPPRPGVSAVFDVLWLGDARAGYSTGRVSPAAAGLLMRWTAIPAEQCTSIAQQLAEGVLDQACRWAADAPTMGNAWTSTEHRFLVSHRDGLLHVSRA